MKKSQILAALALAFALGLGVVAPVANTYAAPRIADTTQKTTATEQEVKNAIKNIEDNTTYQNYAALAKDVKDITDAKVTDADKATAYADVAAAKSGLTAAATTVKIGYNTNDSLAQIIATVENNAEYKLWATLIEKVAAAENVVDQTVKEGTVFTELFNAMKAIKSTITLEDDDDLAALITDAEALALTGDQSYATYTNYTTLYNTLKKASKTSSLDATIRSDLGKVQGITKTQIDKATTLANLSTLAQAATNYTAWGNLAAAVDTAKKTNFATSTPTALYQIIDKENTGLLQLLQLAEPGKDYTVADLISAAPENPDQKPDEPGTDQPGTDEPGTDDPSAPGTGVVSAAEGNAATTVSIVAGLATALTALGAGVVAYRSARRSNK